MNVMACRKSTNVYFFSIFIPSTNFQPLRSAKKALAAGSSSGLVLPSHGTQCLSFNSILRIVKLESDPAPDRHFSHDIDYQILVLGDRKQIQVIFIDSIVRGEHDLGHESQKFPPIIIPDQNDRHPLDF